MKIILNKDVQNLGEEGDVREVARGYARNYLIPKGLGVAYTKQNLALLEGKRNAIDKRKEEKRDRAAGLKERIEALNLQIPMTSGESGRLFGSVTNAMLSEELAKAGIEVERKRIEIPEHTIKMTGVFPVKVKLYGSAVATLKVTVTGSQGAAGAPAAETAPARETPAAEEVTVAEETLAPEEATTPEETTASEEVTVAEETVAAESGEVAPESEAEMASGTDEATSVEEAAESPEAEAQEESVEENDEETGGEEEESTSKD